MTTAIAAWLLTYLIHSTILIGLVAILVRVARVRGGAAEIAWRVALVGGFVTATLTGVVERAPSAARLELKPSAPLIVAEAEPTTPAARFEGLSQRTPPSVDARRPDRSESRPERAAAIDRAPPTSPRAESTTPWSYWLVVAAAVTASASMFVHVVRRAALAGRLRRRIPLTDGPLAAALTRLARRSGLRRRVRLTVCERLTVPIAFGILRPEIAIPTRCLDLAAPAAEAMIAHELAHLRRGDPLRLSLFVLIERLFAFQPLNRLARCRWQEAAEFRCDERAAGLVGSGVPLARCLTDVAGWLTDRPRIAAPVLRMASDRSTLSRRIETLLAGQATRGGRALGAAALSIGLGLVLLAPGVGVGAVVPSERPSSTHENDVVHGPAGDTLSSAIEGLDRELAALEREVDALRASITTAGLQGEVGELHEQLTAQLERLRFRRRALLKSARAERDPKGARK